MIKDYQIEHAKNLATLRGLPWNDGEVYAEEMADLRVEIADLKAELADCEKEIASLNDELAEREEEIETLKATERSVKTSTLAGA